MSEIAFYALAALTLAAASGVVVLRNPVHCALSLIATLFLVAVSFAFLSAHLMAALQIIIYAGAIVVLFLFVIMLLNLQTDPRDQTGLGLRAGAAATATAMAVLMGAIIWGAFGDAAALHSPSPGFGTTIELARYLFREHVVAFELTSVLLLVAVVGAVVLARREPEEG